MTTTIFLVRHAAHVHLGRVLSGRQPDLALSEAGQAQARSLGDRFAGVPFAAIQSSPVLRARATAEILASGRGVETVEALTEIEFGEWTGLSFTALDGDARWHAWNSGRASARAPGGESMAEAQERAVAHIHQMAARHDGGHVLMVSHCDIIRAVICHCLGLSLDNILRFDIDPASVSVISADGWGMRVIRLNEGAI